jgi:hypothetical protein
LLDVIPAVYVAIQEQVEILPKSHASNKEAMCQETAEVAKKKVSSYLISRKTAISFTPIYSLLELSEESLVLLR